MPHSEIHKKKLKKNLTVAGMIFLWCAAIWAITMIKIAKADEIMSPPDANGAFYQARSSHQDEILETQEQWLHQYYNDTERRDTVFEQIHGPRPPHFESITTTQTQWNREWHENASDRLQKQQQTDTDRSAWQNIIGARSKNWQHDWATRQWETSE